MNSDKTVTLGGTPLSPAGEWRRSKRHRWVSLWLNGKGAVPVQSLATVATDVVVDNNSVVVATLSWSSSRRRKSNDADRFREIRPSDCGQRLLLLSSRHGDSASNDSLSRSWNRGMKRAYEDQMRSGQRALCFALLFSHGDHPRSVHVVLAKKRSPASKSLYGQFSIAFTSLAYVRTVLYMRSLIYSTVWPIQLLSALLPSQHAVMAVVGLFRSVQTQTRPRLETRYVTIAGPTSRKVPVSLSWCIFFCRLAFCWLPILPLCNCMCFTFVHFLLSSENIWALLKCNVLSRIFAIIEVTTKSEDRAHKMVCPKVKEGK